MQPRAVPASPEAMRSADPGFADDLTPSEIARVAEDNGADKSRYDPATLFALAVLGGAVVALGFERCVANMQFIPLGLIISFGGRRRASGPASVIARPPFTCRWTASRSTWAP